MKLNAEALLQWRKAFQRNATHTYHNGKKAKIRHDHFDAKKDVYLES